MPRLLLSLLVLATLSLRAGAGELHWQPWSDEVFAQAAKEQKFVLLNLHAVWCHWCHVMEKETYSDPKVIELLEAKYLLVEVDADSRPDLANRYEDYGWPATVVFNGQGGEIVKRRGFMPPRQMAALLQAIIDDPTPGPSVQPAEKMEYAHEGAIPAALRKQEDAALRGGYDKKQASWGTTLKYLDWDNVEYCLTQSAVGDTAAAKLARATLTQQPKLLDPAWGGVYQYSAEGDWKHPHFEKLIQFQAENMRIFALASLLWPEGGYVQTARRIDDYVRNFLTSPEGAFYVSQDADLVEGEHSAHYFALDDAGRRKLGVPRIDQHVYARENGWMIHGLCMLYRATGDEQVLGDARKAATWIAQNRAGAKGGYRHGEEESGQMFLGDTLSMGRAFLDLYAVSASRDDFAKAEAAADYVIAHFGRETGFVTVETPASSTMPPDLQYDENVMAARFGNLLFRYSGKEEYRKMAETAMRYLATPKVLQSRRSFVGGALLADGEMASEPMHLTVVGKKDDKVARELFMACQKAPRAYLQTGWLDAGEGKLPGDAVEYPETVLASAFVCTGVSCSAPVHDPAMLAKKLQGAPAKAK